MNAYEQMRDALVKIRNAMYQDVGGDIIIDMGEDAVNKLIGDALAAPPRNCDVGTAEEQAKRMDAFCECYGLVDGAYRCERCQFLSEYRCELNWAQMPYEEGGAE